MRSRSPLRKVLAAFAALIVAGSVRAETPPDAAKLGWMAGSWAGTKDGVASEEHWTTPAGGLLVGMHKDVREGRAAFFEFLRIEERDGRLCYVASPRGGATTAFCAVEIGDRLGCCVAGTIGSLAILYRPHPDPERRRIRID